jgi:hypothetical protein
MAKMIIIGEKRFGCYGRKRATRPFNSEARTLSTSFEKGGKRIERMEFLTFSRPERTYRIRA